MLGHRTRRLSKHLHLAHHLLKATPLPLHRCKGINSTFLTSMRLSKVLLTVAQAYHLFLAKLTLQALVERRLRALEAWAHHPRPLLLPPGWAEHLVDRPVLRA